MGLGITSVLGEWLCLQREMRDIVIGGPHLLSNPASADRRMRPTARWAKGSVVHHATCAAAGGSAGRRRGAASGGGSTEMVSLRSNSLPSPASTPRAITVSAFQAPKLPGNITGTRSSSIASGGALPV